MICLNGAAARCVSTGDKIIIMAYGQYSSEEAASHKPAVVFVDEKNQISRVTNYERHGASQRYGHIKSSTIIQIVFRDNSDFRKEPISES